MSDQNTPTNTPATTTEDEEAKIAARLQPIKDKLNNAFGERDAALKKAAELEAALAEAKAAAARAKGDEIEALKQELAAARTERDSLKSRTTELSRDTEVRASLAGVKFKNNKASELAFNAIVTSLKEVDGNWVSKDGDSISEFVEKYVNNKDNDFLFEPPVTSGPGGSGGKPTSNTSTSVFGMKQSELLKGISAGEVRRNRKL